MKAVTVFTIAWVGLIGLVTFNTLRLQNERDAAIQRAAKAEASAAELLDVLNGRQAMVEVMPNGARVYTVLKMRTLTVHPIIMAEAK
jgi:hypothetical protein